MLQFKMLFIPDYGYNIEPGGFIHTIHFKIKTGRMDHTSHTLLADEIFGIAPLCRCAGFNLHKNNVSVIFRNNINFITTKSPVSLYNTMTFGGQIVRCSLFSFPSQFVVISHLILTAEKPYNFVKIQI